MVETLQHYIANIREQSTPFGLHTFGVSPTGERLAQFTNLISQSNTGKPDFYREALTRSGAEERRMLLHGLSGKYVAPGPGSEPVRSPGSLPTGRNFYTFDPRTIPVPYADSVGRMLAQIFVQNFQKENKKFPTKVAFEIWGNETIRHLGMQQAQGLALLGVRLKHDKQAEWRIWNSSCAGAGPPSGGRAVQRHGALPRQLPRADGSFWTKLCGWRPRRPSRTTPSANTPIASTPN